MSSYEFIDEDWLADVISDSFDMDWTARDGARAILRAAGADRLIPAPQFYARVTELLAANNREVERRRIAERALAEYEACRLDDGK